MVDNSPEGRTEPEVLYHYTSLEGLIGIMNSGTLWASYVGRLNDRKEVEVGMDVVRDVLAGGSAGEGLLGKVNENADLDRIFVTCFTEQRDFLPLWRSYAVSPGGGYAIGFRRSALESAVVVGSMPPRHPTLTWVRYDPDEFSDEIRAMEAHVADSEDRGESWREPDWNPQGMLLRAATLKERGWSDEREWRLVEVHHTMCGEGATEELKVRPSLYGPYPYLEFQMWDVKDHPIGLSVESCIESIWIGPEPNQVERGAGAEFLLRKAGLDPVKADASHLSADGVSAHGSLIRYSEWATR